MRCHRPVVLPLAAVLLMVGACRRPASTPSAAPTSASGSPVPATATAVGRATRSDDGTITVLRAVTPSANRSLAVIRTHVAARQEGADPASLPTPTRTPTAAIVTVDAHVVAAPELGLQATREAVGALSLPDARAWCRQLGLGGHHDWRVPTLGELEALLGGGFVPSDRLPVERLWTTTPHPVRGVWALAPEGRARIQLDGGLAQTVCVREGGAREP